VTISFAPKPTLLISASPNNVAVKGTVTVTVIARNSDGSAVTDGTAVTLTTTLGTLTNSRPTTQGGIAMTTLQAGTQPGTATITGIVGTSDAATTMVTIRDAAVDINLQADSQTIPASGGTINFSAFVTNSQGQPLQGASVTFSSQVGTFASTGVVFTDTNGIATDKLTVTQAQLAGRTSFTVTARTPSGNGQLLESTTTITVQ
jgi:adhesin/invasin